MQLWGWLPSAVDGLSRDDFLMARSLVDGWLEARQGVRRAP